MTSLPARLAANRLKCSLCKHWTQEEYTRVAGGLGLCNKAAQLWRATEWGFETEVGDVERVTLPEFAGQLMFVQDGSDYRAELYTKGDFFCAHFEVKEGDNSKDEPANVE